MKENKLKKTNIFLYKIGLIAIISIGIAFGVYYAVDSNRTEYFYDFEHDTIGSFPSGFVGIGRSIDHTEVVEWNENDEHDGKVVYISYLDRIYLDKIDYSGIELNTLFNRATEGAISFDIYFLQEDLGIAIDVCQEDQIWDRTDDICLRINYNGYPDFAVRNSEGRIEEINCPELKINQWYRFEIEFDCQQNEWSIYIYTETMLIGSGNFRFDVQPSYLSQIYFATYKLGEEFYIDNVYISLS